MNNYQSIDLRNRFDILIKFLYARSLEINIEVNIFKDIYYEHLRVWNNFYEHHPRKVCFDDYNLAFKNIIESIKCDKFDWDKSPIPINNNHPINGAHRMAASILYKKPIKVINSKNPIYIWDENFFRNRGLKEEYIQIVKNKLKIDKDEI
jgi:hypothetical protein